MHDYFLRFQIMGEVAEMLLLEKPRRRLLVDVSVEPAVPSGNPFGRYPNRASFTITDAAVIKRFVAGVAPGDVIEAMGSFSQSSYIPHRTSHIDTTFLMHDFRNLGKSAISRDHAAAPTPDGRPVAVH